MKATTLGSVKQLLLKTYQTTRLNHSSNTSSSEKYEVKSSRIRHISKELEFQIKREEGIKPKCRGRWTKAEKERFITALTRFGKNWKKVEAYVGTRAGEQIRSHAQKYFMKLKSKDKGALNNSKENFEKKNVVTIQKPKINTNCTIQTNETELILTKLKQLEHHNEILLAELYNNQVKELNGQLELQQELIAISQEAFKIVREIKYNPEMDKKCTDLISHTNKALQYLTFTIRTTINPYCSYLIQSMQQYGFNTLTQINDSYLNLSDWVNITFKSGTVIPERTFK